MTPDEFDSALAALSWKAADFTRKAGLVPNTAWRWRKGLSPIPELVGQYLAAVLEIQRLHARFAAGRGAEREPAASAAGVPEAGPYGLPPVPEWVGQYLGAVTEIQRLHGRFVAVGGPVGAPVESTPDEIEASPQG